MESLTRPRKKKNDNRSSKTSIKIDKMQERVREKREKISMFKIPFRIPFSVFNIPLLYIENQFINIFIFIYILFLFIGRISNRRLLTISNQIFIMTICLLLAFRSSSLSLFHLDRHNCYWLWMHESGKLNKTKRICFFFSLSSRRRKKWTLRTDRSCFVAIYWSFSSFIYINFQ